MSKTARKTLLHSNAKAAPLQIITATLPFWLLSMLIALIMPATGIISFFVLGICLFILPFKAKKAPCPKCNTEKLIPFSGLGSNCKGCGYELVLRGDKMHLLEHAPQAVKPPSHQK